MPSGTIKNSFWNAAIAIVSTVTDCDLMLGSYAIQSALISLFRRGQELCKCIAFRTHNKLWYVKFITQTLILALHLPIGSVNCYASLSRFIRCFFRALDQKKVHLFDILIFHLLAAAPITTCFDFRLRFIRRYNMP